MDETHLTNQLRVSAPRKRWVVGMRVDRGLRTVQAALVGCDSSGLAGRMEIFGYAQRAIPSEARRLFLALRHRERRVADAAVLAAHLAEVQAELLAEWKPRIAPAWERILAVAVDDPGLWSRNHGIVGYLGLCDAARLADRSGQNVIDAFPARDLAQLGRGRPLYRIPYWLLLHDLRTPRLLVQLARVVRLTYLPASRDGAGAALVRCLPLAISKQAPEQANDPVAVADAIQDAIQAGLPGVPRGGEVLLSAPVEGQQRLAEAISQVLGGLRVISLERLGIERGALNPAAVGVLGLLHLDQVPAASLTSTGARMPRVLGRLTPGSLPAWQRLVQHLATCKPAVVPLRSAI